MIYTKIDEGLVTVENPLIQYYIVRESLGMSAGKIGAQIGHAAMMLLLEYFHLKEESERSANSASKITEEQNNIIERMDRWLWSKKDPTGFRKVTLSASDKEWEKVKAEFASGHLIIVKDAGITEVPSGSETIMALYPMFRGENKIIKRLQVLK